MSRLDRLSDAQANAEALAHRGRTYADPNGASFSIAWDVRRRQPTDLREAAMMVRRACSEEVPTRLHEGPDSIGPDGTPKMTSRAEGYIFGSALSSDVERDADGRPIDLVSYYYAPFRALLATLEAERAAIVRHVAAGQTPQQAALNEGVPAWCAKIVVESVLRSFLKGLTDMKVHVPKEHAAA